MSWFVFYAGSYIGTVTAKTSAAALRKARYEWGSSGAWTDAQLKQFSVRKANPASGRHVPKAQKREKAAKASAKRRVAVALAKFLKQANPAMKTTGATVTRLKGGGFTIRPIK